jgi:hypothetical protein
LRHHRSGAPLRQRRREKILSHGWQKVAQTKISAAWRALSIRQLRFAALKLQPPDENRIDPKP